jgi:hypothetical protein
MGSLTSQVEKMLRLACRFDSDHQLRWLQAALQSQLAETADAVAVSSREGRGQQSLKQSSSRKKVAGRQDSSGTKSLMASSSVAATKEEVLLALSTARAIADATSCNDDQACRTMRQMAESVASICGAHSSEALELAEACATSYHVRYGLTKVAFHRAFGFSYSDGARKLETSACPDIADCLVWDS